MAMKRQSHSVRTCSLPRQVKEDQNNIFKAKLRPVELERGRFHHAANVHMPTPSLNTIQGGAMQRQTNSVRTCSLPRQVKEDQNNIFKAKLRPVELECGRFHHAANVHMPTPSLNTIQGAMQRQTNSVRTCSLPRQVKEDQNNIFKAKLRPVELECGRFHHAANVHMPTPSLNTIQGAMQRQTNSVRTCSLLRQVKEDQNNIFKAKLRPVELECGRFHHAANVHMPTPSLNTIQGAMQRQTNSVRTCSSPRQVKEDQNNIFKAKLRPVELECGRFHHAANVHMPTPSLNTIQVGPCNAKPIQSEHAHRRVR